MRGYTVKSARWYLHQFLIQPWTERAECIRFPRLPWTGEPPRDTRPGQNARLQMGQVCAHCPVLEQCARYALTGHNGNGVDGGFYAGVWIPWASYYHHAAHKFDRDRAHNELRMLVDVS